MRTIPKLMLIGTVLVLAPAIALAGGGSLGKREYKSNCAVCHGLAGKGDGPYAGYLERSLPSLTVLAKNNNGVFPFDRVFEVIDGRAEVKAHGLRAMPIWGDEYNDKAIEYHSDFYSPYNAESFVRGRILALITYIYGLQER